MFFTALEYTEQQLPYVCCNQIIEFYRINYNIRSTKREDQIQLFLWHLKLAWLAQQLTYEHTQRKIHTILLKKKKNK